MRRVRREMAPAHDGRLSTSGRGAGMSMTHPMKPARCACYLCGGTGRTEWGGDMNRTRVLPCGECHGRGYRSPPSLGNVFTDGHEKRE